MILPSTPGVSLTMDTSGPSWQDAGDVALEHLQEIVLLSSDGMVNVCM